jgi:hypothetical protein
LRAILDSATLTATCGEKLREEEVLKPLIPRFERIVNQTIERERVTGAAIGVVRDQELKTPNFSRCGPKSPVSGAVRDAN